MSALRASAAVASASSFNVSPMCAFTFTNSVLAVRALTLATTVRRRRSSAWRRKEELSSKPASIAFSATQQSQANVRATSAVKCLVA